MAAKCDALRQRVSDLEAERRDIIGLIQARLQPAGSPPPGSLRVLVSWIIDATLQRVADLQDANAGLRGALEHFIPVATYSGAMTPKGAEAFSALYETLVAMNHCHTSHGIVYASAIFDLIQEAHAALSAAPGEYHQRIEVETERLRLVNAGLRKALKRIGHRCYEWLVTTPREIVIAGGAPIAEIKQIADDARAATPADHQAPIGQLRAGLAWAYQFAAIVGAPEWALDNLSALSQGAPAPHGWQAAEVPAERGMEKGRIDAAERRGMERAAEESIKRYDTVIALAVELSGFVMSYALNDVGPNSEWDRWKRAKDQLNAIRSEAAKLAPKEQA